MTDSDSESESESRAEPESDSESGTVSDGGALQLECQPEWPTRAITSATSGSNVIQL